LIAGAGAQSKLGLNTVVPGEDTFYGWAPDVVMLNESDLRKIEKQEERKARYEKRRK
jgi:hypothetical protein